MYINTNYYIYIDMIRNIIVGIFHWNRAIGLDNKLLWHLPPDMKRFKDLTIGDGNNAVLMGRKTMESLPKGYLPKRDNIILSKTLKNTKNTKNNNSYLFNDVKLSINFAENQNYDELWIIGGEEIYRTFLLDEHIDNIYVTNVIGGGYADSWFPVIPNKFDEISRSKIYKYGELQYFYQKYKMK